MASQNLVISKKLIVAFSAVLGVVALTSVAIEFAVHHAEDAIETRDASFQLAERLDNAMAAQFDQSSDARGFLLSGQSRYHELYAAAVKQFDDEIAAARNEAADRPDIAASINQFAEDNAAWRHDVGDPEMQLGGDPQTAPQAIAIAKSTASVDSMLRVRAAAADLRAKATALSAGAAEAQAGALWLVHLAQIIGGVLALLVAAYAGYQLERRIAFPIRILNDCMRKLAQGRIDVGVPPLGEGDEIAEMSQRVQVFKENAVEKARLETAAEAARKAAEEDRARQEIETQHYIEAHHTFVTSITEALQRLSDGDLTFRLSNAFTSEYEKIRGNFNVSIEKLQQVMLHVNSNTRAIRSGTQEISTAADDLSRRTEQQAASLEETAAALDEITATVRKTADGATHARELVATARSDAEKGGGVVRQAIGAMSAIEKSSQQISQIISVIDEIAFQTNLLALNAGVEAARAGDAGRGFAVVASEVRALAQRSAEAAKEIKGLISASSTQVKQGVDLVAETGKALERIFTQVAEMDSIVADIATSAREQATGLQEVNTAVNQMDQVTQQNAAMVEESTAASHTLSQETEELSRLVGRFQVGEIEAPRKPQARGAEKIAARALKTVGARGGAAPKPVTDEWEEF
ncbi:methyl-accepting chemotaxis protein [Methylovirgula ligni]|uniref:Methyl-accepting chemotaxis protein n=1 Tax=Methylovirgula ligni TaxID=569860 RepID=A0A3D9Z2I0_9HYPH|nr:methyl-accepting chemotaxis protein [Methylovirgula ligni]REF89317.1 methyl-accepting chemotaxis protein [Methylovirgula ligni]